MLSYSSGNVINIVVPSGTVIIAYKLSVNVYFESCCTYVIDD